MKSKESRSTWRQVRSETRRTNILTTPQEQNSSQWPADLNPVQMKSSTSQQRWTSTKFMFTLFGSTCLYAQIFCSKFPPTRHFDTSTTAVEPHPPCVPVHPSPWCHQLTCCSVINNIQLCKFQLKIQWAFMRYIWLLNVCLLHRNEKICICIFYYYY